jgi:hypothetical protein
LILNFHTIITIPYHREGHKKLLDSHNVLDIPKVERNPTTQGSSNNNYRCNLPPDGEKNPATPDYVKDNYCVLQCVLGQNIFKRKIDFESQAEIYTRERCFRITLILNFHTIIIIPNHREGHKKWKGARDCWIPIIFLIFQTLKGIQLHWILPIIIIDVIYLQICICICKLDSCVTVIIQLTLHSHNRAAIDAIKLCELGKRWWQKESSYACLC